MSVYKHIYVYLDVRLPSAWTVRRILFIFRIQKFINHRSVPVNMNGLIPKIVALQIGHKKQNGDFLEKHL
jgi:hypothetical protein